MSLQQESSNFELHRYWPVVSHQSSFINKLQQAPSHIGACCYEVQCHCTWLRGVTA